jgi:hypothetical protein
MSDSEYLMQPTLIRNFPGVIELQFKLLTYTPSSVLPAEVEDALNAVSKALFGITEAETIHPDHEEYADGDPWQWSDEYSEHENHFEMIDLDDTGLVDAFLDLNLDFRDERGQPLRCLMWLRRQAEAAARGFMGTVPNPAEGAFATRLAAEAEAFSARLKKRREDQLTRGRSRQKTVP